MVERGRKNPMLMFLKEKAPDPRAGLPVIFR
jgi:hypothetical protein